MLPSSLRLLFRRLVQRPQTPRRIRRSTCHSRRLLKGYDLALVLCTRRVGRSIERVAAVRSWTGSQSVSVTMPRRGIREDENTIIRQECTHAFPGYFQS